MSPGDIGQGHSDLTTLVVDQYKPLAVRRPQKTCVDLAFAGNDRCRAKGYIHVPVGIENILNQAIEPPIANAIEIGSKIPALLPHPVAG